MDSAPIPEPPEVTPKIGEGSTRLRPATMDDLDLLLEFFADPVIERWWFPHDSKKVSDMIRLSSSPVTETNDEEHFAGWVVLARDGDGETFAGWIQAWEDLDPEYPSASIDIAIAATFHGKGVAGDSLRLVMDYLVRRRGHHRITIDPETDNARAVAAYRKAGFRDVGVMRHYCRRPDGTLSDGLLMEYVVGIDRPVPSIDRGQPGRGVVRPGGGQVQAPERRR
ncbi:MAG: GNAT family N-acetyltransferase [Microthrixaceae bacterium]